MLENPQVSVLQPWVDPNRVGDKVAKVERYLLRSRDNGTLTE